MEYLIIDAALNGTGIRDKYNGGYLDPKALGISFSTITRLNEWLLRYEYEHYNGFNDNNSIDELDKEGECIAQIVKQEMLDVKVEYYSAARCVKLDI